MTPGACSGGGEESGSEPATSPLGGAIGKAFDPDREGPAAPIEGAVRGGTVFALSTPEAGIGAEPMDPTEAYNPIPASILSGLVTRSLTQYAYDPEQNSMILVPDLATDLGTPNEDFTEWSFTIRDGVRFENGTEVTAEDVEYAIKRSFDRLTFKQGPGYSNEFFLDGDSYRGVYTSGTSYSGVRVEGNTLTIRMERPFPDMPYWAAFPAMSPIPERHSDPVKYALHPLATGPYKFADYTPGKSLTLVRNEEWDPNTDPGRHDYPDRYEFDFTVPWKQIDATILGDSAQGRVTVSMSGVLNYRRAQDLDRLAQGSGPCTYLVYPDYREVTDIRVRQAIGYAYPYKEAIEASGRIVGVTALPGRSVLPIGFPGRRQYNVLQTEPGETDAARARALLEEAGFAPGEYELKFGFYPDSPVPVELLVRSLEVAGFKATPREVPMADWERFNHDPDAPVNLRFGGWCSDWPAGGSWFPPLFQPDGFGNLAQFAEPAVSTAIERIRRMPFEEQPAAWGALDESIMTDYYPVITRFYEAAPILHGSMIGGVNADGIYRMPTWKDLYVEQ